MKNILLVCLALSSVSISCHKQCSYGVPACLSSWIDMVKGQSTWNPPAEVHEYVYKGKRVFLLSANCCDQYETLIDEKCNFICAPRGGFTGKGDGACADFFQVAKYVKLVWRDQR